MEPKKTRTSDPVHADPPPESDLSPPPEPIRGRGTSGNPPNRFLPIAVERDGWRDPEDPAPETVLLRDASRSALAWNDSPDLGFDASLNPYRGCEHGCV